MTFEQVFTYAWKHHTGKGSSVLSVAYEPDEAGRAQRWLLLAGLPDFSELLGFDDAAHVREFALAVLELPLTARIHEQDIELYEETGARKARSATLTVGRDPSDALRAYFAYQSYYDFPGRDGLPALTGLGLQVVCDDVDVARAHAEARALLAALDETGLPGQPA
ncbi:hypothetical protein OG765_03010 [Streptomyces sp. NBC_00555]|uniref:hypothetical protein n=1 Tax=Streptomyces sp. NBC_00555 TaxID=2903662 RepID=UPI00225A1E3A|nr:hypothetical protein [Streptomyces sp. NBC_00555]MCX5009960.1 hypothetical protein [Streptomyces sp. NBC_00555]